jgi:hypothetical protein
MSENQETKEVAKVAPKETKKVELTIAGLQADLRDGLTRKQQAVKYGVPLAAINRAYKATPALKGKRVFTPRGGNATQIVFTDADQFASTENSDQAASAEVGTAPVENTAPVQEASAPASTPEAPVQEASAQKSDW